MTSTTTTQTLIWLDGRYYTVPTNTYDALLDEIGENGMSEPARDAIYEMANRMTDWATGERSPSSIDLDSLVEAVGRAAEVQA